ncbi:GNAT family N-acetyltransferase [Amylibacter sp. IMCC11727]|uniref:GNAT family N-acetyltransferase n=1 Tax=Amylibacter sp. IMCC11727 TaxID=3039851 RepID=UPI00244DBB78|nr:GNAT family N-acetyltransferase [Amylibacter sp. IMCC11727]WGI21309.1 GNAT family N-acetyltransferase [Amylibacter sp. IMCC11727]
MNVREATPADAAQMCALLNEIIEIGGTTAAEEVLSLAAFHAHYFEGEGIVSLFVAEQDGAILGFQKLNHLDGVSQDIGDIATFARASNKVKGVGRALFERTKAAAIEAGFSQINARIRADNVPGMGYYAAIGFAPFDVVKDVPLKDGTPVDRMIKRYALTN